MLEIVYKVQVILKQSQTFKVPYTITFPQYYLIQFLTSPKHGKKIPRHTKFSNRAQVHVPETVPTKDLIRDSLLRNLVDNSQVQIFQIKHRISSWEFFRYNKKKLIYYALESYHMNSCRRITSSSATMHIKIEEFHMRLNTKTIS